MKRSRFDAPKNREDLHNVFSPLSTRCFFGAAEIEQSAWNLCCVSCEFSCLDGCPNATGCVGGVFYFAQKRFADLYASFLVVSLVGDGVHFSPVHNHDF